MKKKSVVSFATATSIAALFAATSAFGAQNVANVTQKGSLLVFPLITTDTSTSGEYGPQDTLVEISNDQVSAVNVECEYVNEAKGRVDFNFQLTAKQTVSWDVGTMSGDQLNPPQWPTNSQGGQGDNHRGELVCFATDAALANQIAWNELTGTATVMSLSTPSATEAKQSYRYNAWAFAARAATGLAADGTIQGTPGKLVLSGGGAGTYDACPAYNVGNIMPNGASLGNVANIKNDLVVVSCAINLTEQGSSSGRKLEFTVWNSDEEGFTGAYACVGDDSTVVLGETPAPGEPTVVGGSNFDETTLKTPNARFEVQGISNPVCNGGSTYGLLGILQSSVSLAGDKGSDELDGSPLTGAGVAATPGFVVWTPSSGVQQRPRSGWRQ